MIKNLPSVDSKNVKKIDLSIFILINKQNNSLKSITIFQIENKKFKCLYTSKKIKLKHEVLISE